VISDFLVCKAMLCHSSCGGQRKPFIVSFCRCASDVQRRSIREVYDEASDGAFVERSVLAGEFISFRLRT